MRHYLLSGLLFCFRLKKGFVDARKFAIYQKLRLALFSFSMELLFALLVLVGLTVGAADACEQRCRNSFPHHTYPKKEPFYACLRGCRLQRINEVTGNWNSSKNGTESACAGDCSISYSLSPDLMNACKIGCKARQHIFRRQEALPKQPKDKAFFYTDHYYILHPLLAFKQYCSGFYTVGMSHVRVDTSVVIKDGETINMDIEMKHFPGHWELRSVSDRARITVFREEKEPESTVQHTQTQSTWLDCVSSKAGIPKWLLGGALFVSLTSILYLCCCTCFESSENDEKRHKFENVFTIEAEKLGNLPFYSSDQAPLLPPKYSEKGGIL